MPENPPAYVAGAFPMLIRTYENQVVIDCSRNRFGRGIPERTSDHEPGSPRPANEYHPRHTNQYFSQPTHKWVPSTAHECRPAARETVAAGRSATRSAATSSGSA